MFEGNSGVAPSGRSSQAVRETISFGIMKKLEESHERFRTLVEQANDAILIETGEEEILYANSSACDLTGYSVKELLTMLSARVLHPEDGYLLPMVKYGMYESVMQRKDGTSFPVELSISPFKGGRDVLYMVIIRDISDRKMAELLLQESEDRLLAQYKSIPIPTITLEKHANGFKLVGYNDAMRDVTGGNIIDYSGEEISDLFDQSPEFTDYINACFTGESNLSFDTAFRFKPGEEEKAVSVKLAFVPPDRVMIHIEDISNRIQAERENRLLQEQLFQAQKMESIGRLAGGIAHDFNNILTGLMGYAELIKMQVGDNDPSLSKQAEAILKGSERASMLTQHLLGFARKGQFHPAPVSVNSAIAESMEVTEKMFEKTVGLSIDFDKNIKAIKADRTQLDQVFTNLLINSKDAMPEGGKIHVKTENVSFKREKVAGVPVKLSGSYVKVTLSDTGTGIPPEIRKKIFEPFFTTKKKGKGTGLGLATVYGIIKNHKGHIVCDSQVGKGTTFTIYFPATEKKPEAEIRLDTIVKGDETVLIVDDEKSVRDIMRDQLTSLGYKTFEAENGLEALKNFEKMMNKIDLILLDMIMPKMSGEKTFVEIKRKFPEKKILLMSGFSLNGTVARLLKTGDAAYIQKPFKLTELSSTIKTLLNPRNVRAEA